MRLINQGMILGEDDGRCPRACGNVINPDDIVKDFGADTMRVYEMFMGPLEVSKPWSTAGLVGVSRFLEKLWALSKRVRFAAERASSATERASSATERVSLATERGFVDGEPDKDSLKALHRAVKKVTLDTSTLNLNTAISAMMIYANELGRLEQIQRSLWEPLVLMLAPYAPHLAEELWERAGHAKSLAGAGGSGRGTWPTYDESLCTDETKEIVVQVNGKIRERFIAAAGSSEAEMEAKAMALPKVAEWTRGKQIAKVVVIKDKLVNIVVRG